MEKISVELENLVALSRRSLTDGGRLSTAIGGFFARSQQIELALAIAEAIAKKSILVAEAGTGTGKTYAYLTPSLLSGKKTLISTATKTLQDQLVYKDLPLLIKSLGLSIRVQNLKGRANYICLYRTDMYAKEGRFSSPECVNDILYVHERISRLNAGERSELPDVSEDSKAWPYVTSTSDNCLGRECSEYQDCFLTKARKRAQEADVVVINHHLFFADSRLKNDGFGELLPNFHTVIFDEAHKLAEIATNFHGLQISTRQLRDLMDDILREWPILDLVKQPLKQQSLELDKAVDAVMLALGNLKDKVNWQVVSRKKDFSTNFAALIDLIQKILECFTDEIVAENQGLSRCKQRLVSFDSGLQEFIKSDVNNIRWLEIFKRSLVFHLTPYDIAKEFKQLLESNKNTYIFTSATLTISSSFDCFIKPLGIDNPNLLMLSSPFDFQKQALLYLPRGLPDPRSTNYYEVLISAALPVINACGGRCFFLFTSHRALRLVARALQNKVSYPVLIQGEESKPILLERFRQMGNAILLGSSTFWEGVDVRGEALSCVIIDKLPFASPVDPVIRGRMAYLEAQGVSGFDELSLPNAVIALKQGVGRLIRDVTDSGVLMLADPRLTSRNYGELIFKSLPDMQKTRDEETVLKFINELALTNEPACN
ncbi:MAG: ATP-dependent DNA helicase [Legionellaceae bacterium]|nr:ATP-dependent DNA helicase [Legionellaceae bacterium]